MPYIKQSRRDDVDHIIDDMVEARVDAKGGLNYILLVRVVIARL